MIFLNDYQGALKAKKASLQLREERFNQRQKFRRILRQEAQLFIGSTFFVVLTFFTGLGLGVVTGGAGAMNFLPHAVACKSATGLCYKLRWDKSSVVLLQEKPKAAKSKKK